MFDATHVNGLGSDKYHLTNSTAHTLGEELKPLSVSDWIQWCLSAHYGVQLVLVLVSVLIQRQTKQARWLMFDVAGSLCFLASCVLKYHTGDLTEFYLEVVRQISTQFWTREEAEFVLEHREGWVYFLQGVSAALLVVRFIHSLSVFRAFGTFVLTYFNMFSGLRPGLVVALLLWFAFTLIRVGLTMLCQAHPDYLLMSGSFEDDVPALSCSHSFPDAMAFLFNTKADWHYDGQMTALFWLYFVIFCCFNVVLMNLFIALMTSKYTECMKKADRTWTIQRYHPGPMPALNLLTQAHSLHVDHPLSSVPPAQCIPF